jgi:hypothetical protein
LSLPS